MEERRKPPSEVTPQYEDAGIFKNQIVQLTVQLVPIFGQNSRQDIMIKGYVDGNSAIDVVFPGRRKEHAKPLLTRLQHMLVAARKKPGAPVPIDDIRHPVRIEGAWRPRFKRDDHGWETRDHQLYAARWMVMNQDGQTVTFGAPPAKPVPQRTGPTTKGAP